MYPCCTSKMGLFKMWIPENWLLKTCVLSLKPVFNIPHFEKAHFSSTTTIATTEHNSAQSVVHVK